MWNSLKSLWKSGMWIWWCKPVRNIYKTFYKGWLENLMMGMFEALSAKSDLIIWWRETACNLYSLCLTNHDSKDLQVFDASPQSLLCNYCLKIPHVCVMPGSYSLLLPKASFATTAWRFPMFVYNAWILQPPRLLILQQHTTTNQWTILVQSQFF